MSCKLDSEDMELWGAGALHECHGLLRLVRALSPCGGEAGACAIDYTPKTIDRSCKRRAITFSLKDPKDCTVKDIEGVRVRTVFIFPRMCPARCWGLSVQCGLSVYFIACYNMCIIIALVVIVMALRFISGQPPCCWRSPRNTSASAWAPVCHVLGAIDGCSEVFNLLPTWAPSMATSSPVIPSSTPV